ncbi:hypothetical protein CTI12_AA120490 [Artemisia annua]|uniref:Uncharacterized protein n=1 Tax=Artemisia annua TaxID=35608 RepID=A0A2U1PRQ1_ARTAN|nr:hypothetical protein CTI12_AA120490 [Artemisia annua]
MVSVPNFEQLKEVCGSNELKDCFKFVFAQDESENDGLIAKITDLCNGVRQKISKFADLIDEGQCISHFDATACVGLECLEKAQARNGDNLQALIGALDLARAARDEKREHVMLMDVRD